jgi:hypothetical protein
VGVTSEQKVAVGQVIHPAEDLCPSLALVTRLHEEVGAMPKLRLSTVLKN